jgi:hypothetical protein
MEATVVTRFVNRLSSKIDGIRKREALRIWPLAALICTFSLAGSPASSRAQAKEAEKPKVTFYGFLRVDAVWDDSRMQNHQYAMWVLPEDPLVGLHNDSYLTIYPRVTRFGLNVASIALSDEVTASGKIEIDFQNGGTESRAGLRMRHAYFELTYHALTLLGGQTWQLLSPLYPEIHTDGVLWNAGNLGDRAPQVRLTLAPKTSKGNVSMAVSLGATGAVDAMDLDKNGYLDGGSSALPNVQARIGTEQTLYAGRPIKAGVWGHYAKEETEKPIGGETGWNSWSAGFDLSLPLSSRVAIEGEGWTGSNLSDVRGGIGQNVNVLTGCQIDARGGWAQLATKPTDKTQLYIGASVDDPDDADLPSYEDVTAASPVLDAVTYTGRTLNWTGFLSARYRPWQPFQIAFEYYHWVTEYKGLDTGIDNRVDLHFSYFF